TLERSLFDADAATQAARSRQVDRLRGEVNDLEKELVKRSNITPEGKDVVTATWRQVQETLKEGEAAVEFVRFYIHDGEKLKGATGYVALVITPASKRPTLVMLGDDSNLEGDPVRDYRNRVGRGPDNSARSAMRVAAGNDAIP